jgi:hypothetical protein
MAVQRVAPPLRESQSRNGRWRARFGVGADTGIRQLRSTIAPDNAADGAIRRDEADWFGRAGRGGVCVETAAKHAARIMDLMLAAFIVRRWDGGRMALADLSCGERIGNGGSKGPARANGCKDLHHQRDHEDRNVSFKPPHPQNPSASTYSLNRWRVEIAGAQHIRRKAADHSELEQARVGGKV